MKYAVSFLLALMALMIPSLLESDKLVISGDTSVASLLEQMGEDFSAKKPKDIKNVSAEIGEDIIKRGFSKRGGLKKSKRQSKHFVCTSCHNVEREDPDLSVNDAQARLIYTDQQGLPFLQGTTLYGAVNRDSFYNGDYEKKYKELVKPARGDIREAIQLCAVECAQGRKLHDWEVESILAYMWTIDLKLSDLNLSEKEITIVDESLSKSDSIVNSTKQFVKDRFLTASAADFALPPENRKEGYDLKGDPKNGKLIYDNSCLHCHFNMRYSYFNLGNDKMSLNYLKNKAGKFSMHSIYQVIRYGTYPKGGKKSYMPQYTQEKMSDQQVEDLRAYLEQGDS